jgi:hypothetical protein
MSQQPSELSRREFISRRIAAPAGAAALSGITFLAHPELVFGANDRVRVAICGIRGRGMDHVKNYAKLPNVEIAAICDIDENLATGRIATMEKMGIPKPKMYVDIRRLLEDRISTPFPSPRQTTGTRLWPSGAVRLARMFTSRSPARTTSGRAGNW